MLPFQNLLGEHLTIGRLSVGSFAAWVRQSLFSVRHWSFPKPDFFGVRVCVPVTLINTQLQNTGGHLEHKPVGHLSRS